MNTYDKEIIEYCLAEYQQALKEIKSVKPSFVRRILHEKGLAYGICYLLYVKKNIGYDEGVCTSRYIYFTPDDADYKKTATIRSIRIRIKALKQALKQWNN